MQVIEAYGRVKGLDLDPTDPDSMAHFLGETSLALLNIFPTRDSLLQALQRFPTDAVLLPGQVGAWLAVWVLGCLCAGLCGCLAGAVCCLLGLCLQPAPPPTPAADRGNHL